MTGRPLCQSGASSATPSTVRRKVRPRPRTSVAASGGVRRWKSGPPFTASSSPWPARGLPRARPRRPHQAGQRSRRTPDAARTAPLRRRGASGSCRRAGPEWSPDGRAREPPPAPPARLGKLIHGTRTRTRAISFTERAQSIAHDHRRAEQCSLQGGRPRGHQEQVGGAHDGIRAVLDDLDGRPRSQHRLAPHASRRSGPGRERSASGRTPDEMRTAASRMTGSTRRDLHAPAAGQKADASRPRPRGRTHGAPPRRDGASPRRSRSGWPTNSTGTPRALVERALEGQDGQHERRPGGGSSSCARGRQAQIWGGMK